MISYSFISSLFNFYLQSNKSKLFTYESIVQPNITFIQSHFTQLLSDKSQLQSYKSKLQSHISQLLAY